MERVLEIKGAPLVSSIGALWRIDSGAHSVGVYFLYSAQPNRCDCGQILVNGCLYIGSEQAINGMMPMCFDCLLLFPPFPPCPQCNEPASVRCGSCDRFVCYGCVDTCKHCTRPCCMLCLDGICKDCREGATECLCCKAFNGPIMWCTETRSYRCLECGPETRQFIAKSGDPLDSLIN